MNPDALSSTAVPRSTVLVVAGAWIGLLAALLAPAPAGANAIVQIRTPTLVITPTLDDYDNDYVEATGPFGLQVRVKSTGSSGVMVFVRCPDAAPQIAFGDLLLRTATPPGDGGTIMGAYTPVGPVEQALWSTGVAQRRFETVDVDVRIQNLMGYALDPFATQSYTNTLVFTIVEP